MSPLGSPVTLAIGVRLGRGSWPAVGQHPPAWLGTGEPPRDLGVQLPKPRRPLLDFPDGCCLVSFRHRPLALYHAGAAGTILADGREPYLTSCQVRLEY
jgi:hypothetical protein